MPLHAGSSNKVIGENISEMVHAGHPQKRAVAAAMKKAGKSTKYDNAPPPPTDTATGAGEEGEGEPNQKMVEELAQLLEQNPDQAEELLVELAKTHPEIAEILAKFGGGGEEGEGEEQQGEGEEKEEPVQNSFMGGATNGFVPGGHKKPAAYDAEGRPLYYRDDFADVQAVHSTAPGESSMGGAADPKSEVAGQLSEAMAKQPPPGFDQWMAHLEHMFSMHAGQ